MLTVWYSAQLSTIDNNIDPSTLKVAQILGYGAFGTVLKYTDDKGNKYAVKKVPFLPKQIMSEYMTLKDSNCPNIIHFFGTFAKYIK